jgi:hypothetical protein
MPLYHLRLSPNTQRRYNQTREVVVRAKDEVEARSLAATRRGDEGVEVWLDEKQSTCEKVFARGKSVVICVDYYGS